MFKVGDKVQAIDDCYAGYPPFSKYNIPRGDGVVSAIYGPDSFEVRYGEWVSPPVNPSCFRLSSIRSPVVIETVTKTRIVPGVYGRIEISPYADTSVTHVGVRFDPMSDGYAALDADELDAAASVMSTLAKALRDDPER